MENGLDNGLSAATTFALILGVQQRGRGAARPPRCRRPPPGAGVATPTAVHDQDGRPASYDADRRV